MADKTEYDRFHAAPGVRPARVEKLAYRAPGTHSVSAQAEAETASGSPEAREQAVALAELEARWDSAQAESGRRMEELRREADSGVAQARREAEERLGAGLEAARQQVVSTLAAFAAEREEYFAKVEREVVRLALAIAARVLHREAMLDPLLLQGAVRVALGQLGESTGVRLRCPEGQVEGWRRLLAGLTKPGLEVSGDPELTLGECVIEAQVGTVDLGLRAQLTEIERGFFDLLEQRPGRRDAAPAGP